MPPTPGPITEELRLLRALLPAPAGAGSGAPAERAASGGGGPAGRPVSVFCRFRPPAEAEAPPDDASWQLGERSVRALGSAGAPAFGFDRVFGPAARQAEVYSAVEPVVLGALRGHSGAVLCYGQTSAGKTFTMEGPPMDKEAWGIIPRALDTLLSAAAAPAPGAAPRLRLSMLEIYMEQLRDLLDPANGAELHITTDRSGEVCVRGLREVEVQSLRDALEVFEFGRAHRAVAATGMNDRSSRSHCVVIVKVDAGPPGSAGAPPRRAAKLCLADLAGSECLKKTWRGPGPACSQVVEEARAVNQSLTALGLVVRRLAACRRGPAAEPAHVPYRSSKLTRALQDALDGRARVALVVNCSLSRLQTSETLSTLRFGTCARVAIGRSGDAGEERRQLLLQTLRAAREQLAALVAAQASGWPRDAPAALRGGSSSPGSRSRSLSPLELSPPVSPGSGGGRAWPCTPPATPPARLDAGPPLLTPPRPDATGRAAAPSWPEVAPPGHAEDHCWRRLLLEDAPPSPAGSRAPGAAALLEGAEDYEEWLERAREAVCQRLRRPLERAALRAALRAWAALAGRAAPHWAPAVAAAAALFRRAGARPARAAPSSGGRPLEPPAAGVRAVPAPRAACQAGCVEEASAAAAEVQVSARIANTAHHVIDFATSLMIAVCVTFLGLLLNSL